MGKRAGKNKKVLPPLPTGSDLGALFGSGIVFAAEIDARLAGADLGQVLLEKKGMESRPRTLPEKLAKYPAPQEELDLHGCTGEEARGKTLAFINGGTALRLKTLLIITGKGLHSEGPPVLPLVVDGYLEELRRAGHILHYSWGEKGRDRSGAVTVFLT